MFDTIWDIVLPSIYFFAGWWTGALHVEKHYSTKWKKYQRRIKFYQARAGMKVDGII